MPMLSIRTNVEVPAERRGALLGQASRTLAQALGKPERYVMVSYEHLPAMLFAGDGGPLAYLEVKSIGLPQGCTGEISAALCHLLSDQLGVAQDRIYIEFSDAAAHLWGWDGATF
jgi:phenylpyruvate tautomerase PptA (4-oxalocrotonate tautomerase family)